MSKILFPCAIFHFKIFGWHSRWAPKLKPLKINIKKNWINLRRICNINMKIYRYKLDMWSELGHYIISHPYQWICSGKSGRTISRDCFYQWDPVWRNGVWNLPGEFWGIKWCFLGVKNCFSSPILFHAIVHTNTFPMA